MIAFKAFDCREGEPCHDGGGDHAGQESGSQRRSEADQRERRGKRRTWGTWPEDWKMGRISLLPRVILEVSLPRRMSNMISKRWDRLCTKFRVADALQVKRRLWWGCTRCLPPDDRHVHESIALLRQASGQQGSDVAEAEVARGL